MGRSRAYSKHRCREIGVEMCGPPTLDQNGARMMRERERERERESTHYAKQERKCRLSGV